MNALLHGFEVELRRTTLVLLAAIGMVWLAGCSGRPNIEDPECISGSHSLRVYANDAQTGPAGATLAGTLQVELTCSAVFGGAGVPTRINVVGADIRWTVASGGGQVNGAASVDTTTATLGIAAVNWTLGPTLGPQSASATFTDDGPAPPVSYSVAFTATATAPGTIDCNTTAGGTNHDANSTITGNVIWSKADSPHRTTANGGIQIMNGGRLTIEPGAVVCIAGQFLVRNASLVAEGTAAEPIRFSVSDNNDLNRFVAGVAGGYRFVFEHVAGGAASGFTPFTFGAKVLNTQLPATGGGFAALRIANSGRPVTFMDCEVSGTSVGHGVIFDGTAGLTIAGCNLINHAGSGLHDARTGMGLAPIDARGNWWGDAAGPLGQNGDGVSGNSIDASSPLAAAVGLGY